MMIVKLVGQMNGAFLVHFTKVSPIFRSTPTFSDFFFNSEYSKLISYLSSDFKRRFARLLEGDSFRSMEYKLAMRSDLKLYLQMSFCLICSCNSWYFSVLDPKINCTDMEQEPTSSAPDGFWRSPTDDLSPYDLERLKVYTGNLADFHLVRSNWKLSCLLCKLLDKIYIMANNLIHGTWI
jgi:hypothetical protein